MNRNLKSSKHFLFSIAISTLLSACNFGFMSVGGNQQAQKSTQGLAAGLIPTKLFVTAPSSLNVNSLKLKNCVGPFTVTSRSAKNVESGVNEDLSVSLSSSKGAWFFTDSQCSNQVTSVTLEKGKSQVNFYYKGAVTDLSDLSATAKNYESKPARVTVIRAVDHLEITTPPSVNLGVCSSATANVVTKDIENTTFATPSSIGVTITGTDHIYNDPNCQNSISGLNTVNLPIGSTGFSFYFKTESDPPAPIGLEAISAGIQKASGTVGVTRTVTRLKFRPLPTGANVGVCTGAIEIDSLDGINKPLPISATADTEVTFKAVDTGAGAADVSQYFYTDAACSPANVGKKVKILMGQTSTRIYFKAGVTLAGIELSASTAAPSPVLSSVVSGVANPVLPLAHLVTKLKFRTLPTGANVGVCTGAIQIDSKDGNDVNLPISGSVGTTVTFAANDGATPTANDLSMYFYPAAGCTGSAGNTATIPAGQSLATIYFKVGVVKSQAILSATTSTPSLSSDSPTLSIEHTPTRLKFDPMPSGAQVGVCTGAIRIKSVDGLNQPLAITPPTGPQASDTTVTFTATNTAPAPAPSDLNSYFFDNDQCNVPASRTSKILAGQSEAIIYMKVGIVAPGATLTAVSSSTPVLSSIVSGVANPVLNFSHVATKLKFGTLPSVNAGVCSPAIPLSSQDPLDNGIAISGSPTTVTFTANQTSPALNLSSYFYSDPNCTNQTPSSFVFAGGASTMNVYLKIDAAASSAVLGASAAGLSSDSPVLPISQDGATLVFSALPSAKFGQCSNSFLIRTVDVNNAVKAVGQAITVNFSVSAGALFTDQDCSVPAGSSTSFSPAPGVSSITLFYKAIDLVDVASGSATITATSPAKLLNAATPGTINISRQPLVLDSKFGIGGKSIRALSGNVEGLAAAYQASTNSTIVVGYQTIAPNPPQLAIVRFDKKGVLDTNFGTGGIASMVVGNQSKLQAVIVNSTGIYAAGFADMGASRNDFLVVKLNPGGTTLNHFEFDFGSGASANQDDEATAIAFSNGGSQLVVAGNHVTVDDATATPPVTHSQFALAILNASNPASSPIKTTKVSGQALARAVAVDSSGGNKIIVAGTAVNPTNSDNDMALFRFNSNGSDDTTFNPTGSPTTNPLKLIEIPTTNEEARAVLIQSTGGIVLAGSSGSQMALARVLVDGGTGAVNLDSSFGGGLVTSAAMTSVRAMAEDITNAKNLVVAGGNGSNSVVYRYTKNGAIDPRSVSPTVVIYDDGVGGTLSSVANACFVQPDGDVVIAGTAVNQLALSRLLP